MITGLPGCYVDIYPFEGGSFTLTTFNGDIRGCQVSKNIRDPQSGTFQLLLAPGGPYGPNVDPQWTEVITPMSLIVIGFQRLGRAHIAMVGVVKRVTETTTWTPGRGTGRAIVVTGCDFSCIFAQPNFYAQMVFHFTQGATLGNIGAALGTVLSMGQQNVPLQTAANTWYTKVMAGTQGLLSNMTFGYQGSRVKFNDIVSTSFSNYPGLNVTVPTAENFALLNGTWLDTFLGLYPFPWFELFVTTAEPGFYGQPNATTIIQSSQPGFPPASPCIIARPTPIPVLNNPSGPFSVDLSAWENLPVYQLDALPVHLDIEFTDEEVRNFYAVTPTYIGTANGYDNGANSPWIYAFGCWLDVASLERYGYRPFVANVKWFADPTGDAARSQVARGGKQNMDMTVGDIALRAASYYEPMPLMAAGQLVTNLRPDIFPGCRIQLPVSKSAVLWEFYIDGVSHNFTFGQGTTTTLTLSRGLPLDVYNESDLVLALLSGNASRVDGNYTIGLPPGSAQPLQLVNLNNGPVVTSEISSAYAYNTPAQK